MVKYDGKNCNKKRFRLKVNRLEADFTKSVLNEYDDSTK